MKANVIRKNEQNERRDGRCNTIQQTLIICVSRIEEMKREKKGKKMKWE